MAGTAGAFAGLLAPLLLGYPAAIIAESLNPAASHGPFVAVLVACYAGIRVPAGWMPLIALGAAAIGAFAGVRRPPAA